MITINLWDNAFKHLTTPSGIYSCTDNRTPRHVKYVRNNLQWDGITVFTDGMMYNDCVDKVQTSCKIGWLIEPPEIAPYHYQNIHQVIDKFDLIVTHNKRLIDLYPNKCKFVPFGGCWILPENYRVHAKFKLLSMLYSSKRSTTGHKLRHQIANTITPSTIDMFGSGANNPFDIKDSFLPHYMFSIVVENSQEPSYFTEKLLDCFAVGTIPIYWGTPDIGDFFNAGGIFQFDTIEYLQKLLPSLSPALYLSKMAEIKDNLQRVSLYDTQENQMYDNVYYPINKANNVPFDNIDSDDARTIIDNRPQSFWLDKFSKDGGDKMILNQLELDDASLVFDVGSYLGGFGQSVQDKYDSIIYSFEPVKKFYQAQIKHQSDKMVVFNHGFGISNTTTDMYISKDASSQFWHSKQIEKCQIKDFDKFITEHDVQKIDLLAINIEGDEYELLEYIIKKGLLEKIKGLLIQFHYINQYPHERRDAIKTELAKTFNCKFDYPFVWEYWVKK